MLPSPADAGEGSIPGDTILHDRWRSTSTSPSGRFGNDAAGYGIRQLGPPLTRKRVT